MWGVFLGWIVDGNWVMDRVRLKSYRKVDSWLMGFRTEMDLDG